MHPAVNTKEISPECKKSLDELNSCRNQHSIGRIFGFCNEMERNFNECLMKEVKINFTLV
jgi:hypothetical protein